MKDAFALKTAIESRIEWQRKKLAERKEEKERTDMLKDPMGYGLNAGNIRGRESELDFLEFLLQYLR